MTNHRLILALIIISSHAIAQPSDGVIAYFESIRAGKVTDTHDVVKAVDHEVVLLNVLPYLTDSLQIVRSAAYRLIYHTGINSHVTTIRQRTVEYLVHGCSMNTGSDVDRITPFLIQFNREDFTTAGQDSVQSLVEKNAQPHVDLLKLAGYLQLHQLETRLQLITQPGNPQRVRWSALIALARMGDTAALDNLLTRVQKLPINDDVVDTVFPDLIFTRQKPAFDFMVDAMKSSAKNCFSANAENEVAIPCGYRIMELLAPVIQDYPLKRDASGDMRTNNYADALATVNAWFKRHPDFIILHHTFY